MNVAANCERCGAPHDTADGHTCRNNDREQGEATRAIHYPKGGRR